MAWFARRERPPAEVLAAVGKDQRVVSWADTADGGVVVVTPKGLWWPEADGLRCMQWQYIDKVIWQDGRLFVTEAGVEDDLLLIDRPQVSVALLRARVDARRLHRDLDGRVGEVLLVGDDGALELRETTLHGRDHHVLGDELDRAV